MSDYSTDAPAVNGATPYAAGSVRSAARAYARLGWSVIPVPFRAKNPNRDAWQTMRLSEADIDREFTSDRMNVGVLMGDASRFLVDIDLDDADARRMASKFMPDTPARFGRESSRDSHYLYVCEGVDYREFRDPVDKKKLIEVRATSGQQTIFPPSTHKETGEVITWSARADYPFEVGAEELTRGVERLAAAALVARRWPRTDGSRHDIALALSGGLLRLGWSVDEAAVFVDAVAREAGDDEVADRVRCVEETASELRANRKATGWPTLAKLLGTEVVDAVCGWLHVSETADATADDADDADAKSAKKPPPPKSSNQKKTRAKSAASVLTSFGREAELFRTPDGDGLFATFPVDGHRETAAIRSRAFTGWLRRAFWNKTKTPPGQQAVADAVASLEAVAQFDGEERPVFTRVAGVDGKVYLDLADAAWRVVEVDRDGWRVVTNADVRFRRRKGMLALPAPTAGGSLSDLRQFINAPEDQADGDEAWTLITAWLVGTLKPSGPYPLLILGGEQASGKSTTAKMLRSLVDPSLAMLRALPRDERDFIVSASSSWLVAFDNLSYVSDWLSDALCRLATGGGFASRQLYSDDEEALFDIVRPGLINGIGDLASRPDLVDRALVATLPRLRTVKTEAGLWADFFKARPRILGGLLDAVAAALRNRDQVDTTALPRMADFALWIRAAEHEPADGADAKSEVFAWNVGTFDKVYATNRKSQISVSLEADIIAMSVLKMLEDRPSHQFDGTATELLALLPSYTPEQTVKSKDWPKTPRALSGRLRRIAAFLRSDDVDVRFSQEGHSRTRQIHVSRIRSQSQNGEFCVRTVRTVRTYDTRPDEACPDCGLSVWTEADGRWFCPVCQREARETANAASGVQEGVQEVVP